MLLSSLPIRERRIAHSPHGLIYFSRSCAPAAKLPGRECAAVDKSVPRCFAASEQGLGLPVAR